MAKESTASLVAGGLDALGASVTGAVPGGRRPPLATWNPPFCGDIDMRIAADGTWFYAGTPIGRPALVRLFATILRREPDGMMLVTPVEKVRIVVDDAPFVAVELAEGEGPEGASLRFRTNVDDWVMVDAAHPLTFRLGPSDGVKPYVTVRDGLEARVTRALFFDLVERGEVRAGAGDPMFGVVSAGQFFPIASAASIDGLT